MAIVGVAGAIPGESYLGKGRDATTSYTNVGDLEAFMGQLGFIIMTVAGSLFFGMFIGEQALYYFLMLVLFGMVLVNWKRLDSLMKGVMNFG